MHCCTVFWYYKLLWKKTYLKFSSSLLHWFICLDIEFLLEDQHPPNIFWFRSFSFISIPFMNRLYILSKWRMILFQEYGPGIIKQMLWSLLFLRTYRGVFLKSWSHFTVSKYGDNVLKLHPIFNIFLDFSTKAKVIWLSQWLHQLKK